MITYRSFGVELAREVCRIYKENGWSSYTEHEDKIRDALNGSLYILGAFENGILVGFVRCVGDGATILYVQDLIITLAYQRKGIGTELMKRVLEKYSNVRQLVLITDKEDKVSNAFYQSIGLTNDSESNRFNLYYRGR